MKSRPLLLPLVPVYWVALRARDLQFRLRFRRVRWLGWPVVSVGSLSAGGAGKTPLTIALAQSLTARGLHVDVLSRGYARSSARTLLVDSRGTAEDFGDEPLLITRETHVPVYVAAQRFQAGLMAEANQQVGEPPHQPIAVHLLDDGFQHRQLGRDVDILLLSREDLDDRLLPAGNLREPLSAARRADVIAIPADETGLEPELRARGLSAQIWRIRRRVEIPEVDGAVAAFCGIARPEQFFEGLESAGVNLVSRTAFPDHYKYAAADLARIESAARHAGAKALLTTEKDRVRLGTLEATISASLPLKTVQLRTEIVNEDAAIDWLIDCLHGPR